MVKQEQHEKYLRQALQLASQGRGFCAPNPSVGAIVVKDGQILSQGYHKAYGQAHAEQIALNQLSTDQARNAVVYVTLEPCSHWGKTPPCTDILIEQGIKSVYYAYKDTNPAMQQSGHHVLNQHNIECLHTPLHEINEFYNSYHYWRQHQTPWVSVKLAMSLDGKIATLDSKPVTISGEELSQFTHQQRYMTDAILTTAKTINQDNPQLNARLDPQNIIKKRLYILDSALSINKDAQIFQTAASITLFHANNASPAKVAALLAQGLNCVEVEQDSRGLSLAQVMAYIGQQGVHDLWVEAGGQCVQSLLIAGLVNRCLFYISPTWLGENYQQAFMGGRLDVFSRAKCYNWKPFGADVLCEVLFD